MQVNGAKSRDTVIPQGVPQGSVLSPLLFLLYTADLQAWLKHSRVISYADDTSICVSSDTLEGLTIKLEEDAQSVLEYMASNGLVANDNKTALLVYRKGKKMGDPLSIRVGAAQIAESESEEVLGVKLSSDFSWKPHITKVCNTLRHKNFLLKRLARCLPQQLLLKILDGLVFSTVRYCLPIYAVPRLAMTDSTKDDLQSIQVQLNNAMRIVCQKTLQDATPVRELLAKCKALSLNQMVIQCILTLVWKTVNNQCHSLDQIVSHREIHTGIQTKAMTSGKLQGFGLTKRSQDSFRNQCSVIWNFAPDTIKKTQCIGAGIPPKDFQQLVQRIKS